MRRTWLVAFIACLLLLLLPFGYIFAQEATAEPESTAEPEATEEAAETTTSTYTVVRGDNLFRIALRFGTTTAALAAENGITNPGLIYVGQVLRIPGGTPATPTPPPPAPTATPTPTPPPPAGEAYVVQRGDTLFRIAIRNNTTVAALAAANNIANPNIIFVGQRLVIPGGSQTTITTAPSTGSQPAATTGNLALSGDAGFAYGIEVFPFGQNIINLTSQISQLGMRWAKVRVDWRELEQVQGQPNFMELDTVISTLNVNSINILLTVTNAPQWARGEFRDENGPPENMDDYVGFVRTLAERYTGLVRAFEIWDEPNLRRNWNCGRVICEADYLDMLSGAYAALKAVNPDIIVVSAGLAPTGFNDGVNAINDRVFLQNLYTNGLADVSDVIGAHPIGWANPPDARCCNQPIGVETHFEDASFYFLENLEGVRRIMIANGDGDTPIWVTKFGWGTGEDTDLPSELNVFVAYTSLNEQAIYIPRAFALGQASGYVGPMFLDNLNGCQGFPSRAEACYTSLISPDGAPRPAFSAVQIIDKSDESDEAMPTGDAVEETASEAEATSGALPFDDDETEAEEEGESSP